MTSTRHSGFALLRDNRAFRALWLARTLAYLGDFVTVTVLLLYLYEVGASPTQVGVALAAKFVPQALGPLTGVLADRWDPRRLMIVSDLARVGTVGLIVALLPPYPLLLVLIAATGCLSAVFTPASKSAVPKLVPRDRLAQANSMLGVSHNIALATGPVAGAVLFDQVGIRVAFGVDAGAHLLSALVLLMLLPAIAPAVATAGQPPARPARFGRDIAAGLRYVARHRVARAVAVALFLGVLFAAMDNVALVFLIQGDGHGDATAVGAANSLYGLVMVLVPAAIAITGWRVQGARMLLAGLSLSAAGLLLVGVSGSLTMILLTYALAGAGNGLENVAADTAIGENVEDHMLGRVFGAVYGPIFLAATGGQLAAGPLITATSAGTVFVIAGAGLFGVTVLAWLMLRAPAAPAAPTASRVSRSL